MFGEENHEDGFRKVEFEMLIRHPSGDFEQAVEYESWIQKSILGWKYRFKTCQHIDGT